MRLVYLAGSGLWALFAILSLVIMIQVASGNGSDVDLLGLLSGLVRFPTGGEVLLGLGHVVGFVMGSLICLAVSAWLFIKGTVRD